MPQWYQVVRAARILHVPPWELLEQDSAWINLALASVSAEKKAEIAAQKRAAFRNKTK